MATQLQVRRGTTTENNNFTGAVGEITMDTTKNGLRIHDGSTTGGFEVPVIIEQQLPNASNNYTWYRLYSNKWVEQGGRNDTGTGTKTINLPVTMQDEYYTVTTATVSNTATHNATVLDPTTTSFKAIKQNTVCYWEVKGLAE